MKKETERKKTINKNISSKRWGEKRRETACVNCWLGEKKGQKQKCNKTGSTVPPIKVYNN